MNYKIVGKLVGFYKNRPDILLFLENQTIEFFKKLKFGKIVKKS
jgi:hypothetical protein